MVETESVTVSLQEVKAGAKACAAASAARRASDAADAEKSIALMAVFEPLLGIHSESELKVLSLEEVRLRVKRRMNSGVLKLKGITYDVLMEKVIERTQTRRNVAWKDAFIAALGESRATAVIADTPESHSYRLVAP